MVKLFSSILVLVFIIACSKSSEDRKLYNKAVTGKVHTVTLPIYGVSADKVGSASVYFTEYDKKKEFQAFFIQMENELPEGERAERKTRKATINLTARKITKKKSVYGDKVVHVINKNMNLKVRVVKLDWDLDFNLITEDYLENYKASIPVSQIKFDQKALFTLVDPSLNNKQDYLEYDHRRERELKATSSVEAQMDGLYMANLIENMRDEENSNGSVWWVTKSIPLNDKKEVRVLSYVVKLERGFNEIDKDQLKKSSTVTVSYKVLKTDIINGK